MIHANDVLSLLTEHEQTIARHDLEAAWNDSETFTVEVWTALREPPYMMTIVITVDPIHEAVTIERSR